MDVASKTRGFRLTLLLIVVGCFCPAALRQALASPARSAGPSRPNVLLIMADDLGYECLSSYGAASYKTPHLDQLAAGGARFLHCYAQPLCTPTRVQLMTGRYNFRNYSCFGALAQGEKTFAHMLRRAGYATGVFGKWQLDGLYEGRRGQTPSEAGFDRYCLWNYANAKGDRYADPVLAYWEPAQRKEITKTFSGQYGPEICTDQLLDFVEQTATSGTPFFAYYPMILTHSPFLPTPDSEAWSADRHAKDNRFFRDMVETMDRLVGRIIGRLDDLKLREKTLVLFVGDNGTHDSITSRMRDGREIRGGKGYHTDAGTRVPLIANWPGTIAPGQVRDDLIDTTDFLPTIAQATGAQLPTPPGDGVLDGQSFLPQLRGESASLREWVFVGYTEPRQDGFGWPRARFARDRRYKLYDMYVRKDRKSKRVVEDKSGHLYDVSSDPAEEHPILAADDTPETAAVRKQLQAVLDRLEP